MNKKNTVLVVVSDLGVTEIQLKGLEQVELEFLRKIVKKSTEIAIDDEPFLDLIEDYTEDEATE